MTSEQNVGFGALLGGMSAVLTNVGLRYFADNKMTVPKDTTEQPTRPFMYQHAPLLGIVPTAIATFASYKWLGGAASAVACAITGLFASTAPPINDWIVQARLEKDAKASQETEGAGNERESGRMASFARRMAALGKAA